MSEKISHFFPSPSKPGVKRPASSVVIDLTSIDSDDEKPPKKVARTNKPDASSSFFASSSTSKKAAPASSSTQQYRFVSGASQNASQPRTSNQTRLHNAFKRKLLDAPYNAPKASTSGWGDASMEIQQGSDYNSSADEVSFPDFTSSKKGKGKAKKAPKPKVIGPSGKSFTPLEIQVRDIVKANPGTLLLFEVGYKYIFYGEDAKVAAKLLRMVCYLKRNFLTASIPTHRCGIHLKKLLSEGHRVGIVQQIETAALKKISDSKSKLFERKMTKLYTAATFVDEIDSVDDSDQYAPPLMMSIVEEPKGDRVIIGIVSVCASTGDATWDIFEDSHMRSELETRLAHLRPAEMLLPKNALGKPTEKMIQHLTETPGSGPPIRLERYKTQMAYSNAFDLVSDFYKNQVTEDASEAVDKLVAIVADFPKLVVVSLAHLVKHLATFDINLLDITGFTRFSSQAYMLLNANTLRNLEVYTNNTDFTPKGSLIWVLDQKSKTQFGKRLLREWVGRPLVDARMLKERTDAIQEIVDSSSDILLTLRGLLAGLPDLARGLARIQYKQCTAQELAGLLKAFQTIGSAFPVLASVEDVGLESCLLNRIVYGLPALKAPLDALISRLSLVKMVEGKKDSIWINDDKHPLIADYRYGIQGVESDLAEILKQIKKHTKNSDLSWSHVGEDYVLNVKKSLRVKMPEGWFKSTSTAQFDRWTSPLIQAKKVELAQFEESLAAESQKAFLSLQEEITSHYAILRHAVAMLATFDCLSSLAMIALQDGYARPEFEDDGVLEIVEGRHPMVELARSDPFVPNTLDFDARAVILSGPNMAGKSSVVRMTGLLCILAQIGSYVPAKSMRLSLLDAIHTRMGAEDDIIKGSSTFMVEMTETSTILQSATKNSLVILDELGRGTGTWDGMAVAFSALHHLVSKVNCKTLFITHYPMVAMEIEKLFPDAVVNKHMGYTEQKGLRGTRVITFLYRLRDGITLDSFGVECGRLAGMPEVVLQAASTQSASMRKAVEARIRLNKVKKCASVVRKLTDPQTETEKQTSIATLRALVKNIIL